MKQKPLAKYRMRLLLPVFYLTLFVLIDTNVMPFLFPVFYLISAPAWLILLGIGIATGVEHDGSMGYAVLAGMIEFFIIGYILDLVTTWLKKEPTIR